MNLKFPSFAAALLCCLSCIDTSTELGQNFIPVGQTYNVYSTEFPITDIDMKIVDSLSGFSKSYIAFGSIREPEFGLTTRSSCLSLVPLYDTLDFGSNPQFIAFHFAAAYDTCSVADLSQMPIIQRVKVYPLTDKVMGKTSYNCNSTVPHGSNIIAQGNPMANGSDSLSFDFTAEYGKQYMNITQDDLSSIDKYLAKFPGIYIETDEPVADGGRINIYDLQMDYDEDSYYLAGNYAKLVFRSTYDGEVKDTSFAFYYSPQSIMPIDSLLDSYSTGSFPQYALNLTGNKGNIDKQGKAEETIIFEGGGGIKPRISAQALVDMAYEAISKAGEDPTNAIINKATITMPFDFPEDYTQIYKYPDILSPTCRIMSDTLALFMGLTDASSEYEDQGDIDRSNLVYAPDITYHMQELMKMKKQKKDTSITSGNYDIWLLPMHYVTTTTTTEGNEELADYYTQLAYQSYYQSMYGGTSGYSDYYTNYYTYMMAAQYASGSTETSTTASLDKENFYCMYLHGPKHPSGNVPMMSLTFSVPKK